MRVGETYPESSFVSGGALLLEDIQAGMPGFEVRPEQIEGLDAIEAARQGGQERALVQMATGLGKTMLVAADVRRYLQEKPDARVLFLCHQNDILQQAQETFQRVVGEQHSYGIFTGESKDYHEVKCLFASFQVMREWREAFLEDEFDYIVVDESHHAKAPTYEPTLNYFKPDFMLGVTATPDRHDLKDIREIFGHETYKLSLEEAIARDLLTPVRYDVITDEVANTRVLRDVHGVRHNYAQLDREIFAPRRDAEIVDIINTKSEALDNVRRIIFCKSIEQADQYATYFPGAAALHSDIPRPQQDQQIRKFKDGNIDTVTVVDMFNEGIDIPEANQVIFLRSTNSKTVFFQQLGRGLRKLPGKDSMQVLDFVGSCDRLVMLEEMWQEIQASPSATTKLDKERILISLNDVHFNESAREILTILADIEANTDNVRRMRMDGWKNMAELEQQLGISRGFIFRLADELSIPMLTYPNGKQTLRYMSPKQAERLQLWLEEHIQDAPEGYMSIVELTGGQDPKTERIIRDLGIEPRLFRSSLINKLIPYLSPAEVAAVQNHPDMHLRLAPKDFMTKNQVKDALGISFKSLTGILEQLEITPRVYLTPLHYPGSFLSPSEIVRVREAQDAQSRAGSDLVSYNGLRERLKLSDETMSRICQELGITAVMARNNRGHSARHVTVEAADRIESHDYLSLPEAPNGYLKVSDLIAKTGLSDTTVIKMAADMQLEWQKYKNHRGTVTRYLSAEQAEQFMAHPLITAPHAGDEHVSVASASAQLEVSYVTLQRIAKQLGIDSQQLKNSQGRVAEYITAQDLERIQTHPQVSAPIAPSGAKSARELASELEIDPHGFKTWLEEQGYRTTQYRHPRVKRLTDYYSAEDVSEIKKQLGK